MVKRIVVFWMLLFTPFPGISQSPGLEQLIILEAVVLKGIKQKLASEQDKAFPVELKQLMDRANEKLTEGPFSVVNKTQVPPSGDKHDYISMGTYWWPDPNTDDGLPYVRKDGQANPEIYEYQDLWEYKNEEGAGLKEALAFLAPYANGEKSWEYKQILALDPEKLKLSLNIGAFKYQNEEFKKIADQLNTGKGEFIYWDMAGYDLIRKK